MTATLAAFQDELMRLLWSPQANHGLAAQPGFAVYRNTVLKGCVDAVQANYPAVARLVGEPWLRAAAAVYARERPPRAPSLLAYGDGFADFLDRFEPAAGLPYLGAVARLDRLWTEAHAAADAPVLTRAALAGMPPERLAASVLRPHPAARWLWCVDTPAYGIWSRNRSHGVASDAGELDWRGEGALLARPHDAVRWRALDESGIAFLDACAAGACIADAAAAALERRRDTDLAALLAGLIDAGAFAAADTLTADKETP